MKTNKEDIPVTMQSPGTILRAQKGFGDMTVAYNQLPRGTDLSPLLKGLEHDSCQCPHWGYIFHGGMTVKYDDGTQEVLKAGDVFYLPPGHTVIVEEDIQLIDFSPSKELNEVMEHIKKRMTELESK
jgi:hypothetical protein